jgi:lipopolysaccharide/colanic/teichoic acid biosynthesis glycosyltransferase
MSKTRIGIRGMVMINPQVIPLDRLGLRIYKRLFDIVFSSLAILFLFSWLFPILMVLVKLSSKGPFFFVQKRTGTNNGTFNCIKFRTKRVNDDADILQATANDKRITRMGKLMRDTYLDELPQFFNVLMGQMSVVGPRPHMLSHTEFYSGQIDNYLVRHYVKPGVTGWAQVNGYNGETDELWKMKKRVEYDMYYNQNWTPFLDIQIIWNSVFSVKKITTQEAPTEEKTYRGNLASKTVETQNIWQLFIFNPLPSKHEINIFIPIRNFAGADKCQNRMWPIPELMGSPKKGPFRMAPLPVVGWRWGRGLCPKLWLLEQRKRNQVLGSKVQSGSPGFGDR